MTGGVVATSAWNYPNRNLYNNFDEFDSMNDNYAMLEKAQVHSTLHHFYLQLLSRSGH